MDKNFTIWLFRRPISVLRTTLWRSPRSGSTMTAPSSGSQHHQNYRKERLIWYITSIVLILYVGTAPGRTMTFTVGWTFTCSQWTPRQHFRLFRSLSWLLPITRSAKCRFTPMDPLWRTTLWGDQISSIQPFDFYFAPRWSNESMARQVLSLLDKLLLFKRYIPLRWTRTSSCPSLMSPPALMTTGLLLLNRKTLLLWAWQKL